MAIPGYDFEDELIRDMVAVNHTPNETVLRDAAGTRILSVECQQCANLWPCPQITGLRAWRAVNAPQLTIATSSN